MSRPGEEQAVARSGRRSLRERVGRDRRVLRVGLLISALAHLVGIGIVGGLLTRRPPPPRPPTAVVAEPPSGMRAVRIAVSSSAPSPEPVPDPRLPPAEREEVMVVTPEDDAPAPTDADDLSAADRLAPRLVDPRLWRPKVLIRETTLADVQARIDAALELLSDSALAAAEASVRATDWTVRDADGGRWGISPGKLHLGKLTLPLPAYTEEWDPHRGEWSDLEAQVDRALLLESFEDRVRAIRERRDRERRERREQEEGGAVAGGGESNG